MTRISHRKTILSVNKKTPYLFFALDDEINKATGKNDIYVCVLVKKYTPVEGDGIEDLFLCTKVDRNEVRPIYQMKLDELSYFMRINMDLYTISTDIWRPKHILLNPVNYEKVPDIWFPTSLDVLS